MFGHPRCLRCDADLEYMPEGCPGCEAVAQEPVRVGLDLPSWWRVLVDDYRGTVIVLSESGLWVEIDRDLWNRLTPTDPVAVAATDALRRAEASAGVRGRVWVRVYKHPVPPYSADVVPDHHDHRRDSVLLAQAALARVLVVTDADVRPAIEAAAFHLSEALRP